MLTNEEFEQLIEHISCFQNIWDMKHVDHESRHKKDKCWQHIKTKKGIKTHISMTPLKDY